jgi:hypothetical protein
MMMMMKRIGMKRMMVDDDERLNDNDVDQDHC